MCSAVGQIAAPALNCTEPLLFCLYAEVTLRELVPSAWQDTGGVRTTAELRGRGRSPFCAPGMAAGGLGGEAARCPLASAPTFKLLGSPQGALATSRLCHSRVWQRPPDRTLQLEPHWSGRLSVSV